MPPHLTIAFEVVSFVIAMGAGKLIYEYKAGDFFDSYVFFAIDDVSGDWNMQVDWPLVQRDLADRGLELMGPDEVDPEIVQGGVKIWCASIDGREPAL